MNPILIAGALFLFILATSKDGLSNIFNPSKLFDTAAGPGAQQVNKAPTQGKAGQFGPPNYQRGTGTGSPNSTLATVDNSMIVVNNALGFIKNLGEYFGNNDDSEHPVSENVQTTNYAPIDNSQGFTLDSNTFIADATFADSSYT